MAHPNELTEFHVGEMYSNDEIQASLGVGNAGGVRVSVGDDGVVRRAVIMTSVPTARQARENPYHDRIENGVLVYTGAGLEGDQSLGGINNRLPQQMTLDFPMYGFMIVGSRRDRSIGPKRWQFLGLLEYLRHYPDSQVDAHGVVRKVWLFEFRIHEDPPVIAESNDYEVMAQLLIASRRANCQSTEDSEVANAITMEMESNQTHDPARVETIRSQLLGLDPRRFEYLIRDLLVHAGFDRVSVTNYSQDGGIDVNAHAGSGMWAIHGMLVQVQAKRWLHTVGRKEVAELRGSLQPHARGAIVTTSHYSRAAIHEASDAGKLPLVLVDGFSLASHLLAAQIQVK